MMGSGGDNGEMERVMIELSLDGGEKGWKVDLGGSQRAVEDDLCMILLVFVDFWVQIHDFPSGLVLEVMARQFGNFIGTFLDNYMKMMGTGYRGFIQIGVRIDVRGLLKRRKKIILSQNHSLYARFQYK
uniref:DUF4283 domain-containing protein n=1 Tax=Gossypium raimondii TaxID=29730 RepID=A0A0D2TNP6_GOSRA|nr:hypothetical protein B456_007G294500 [Gossypium raimondii]